MSTAAASAGRAPSRTAVLALLAIAGATSVSVPLWGHPGAVAAPVLVAAAFWGMWRAPLRVSVGILVLLLLAVDHAELGNGLWHSPLATIGDLLRLSLRTFVPAASSVPLTGMEIAVLFLLGVAAWRRSRGESVAGAVESPRPVRALAILYVACILYGVANGVARGGSVDVAIWQTRALLLTAALFFLFEAAFRGPADHVVLGKIVVLAAAVRALMALWVRYAIAPGASVPVEYVTDHGDSILFSLACVVLVAHLLERADRKRLEAAAVLLPLLLLGMEANGRRTAWLQLFLAMLVFFVVGRGARWKRPLLRGLAAALPILVLYGAAGWSSTNAVYKPVQLVRSVVDARVDRSTWNRQVEDWNLAMSIRERPLSGRGFGQEWTEFFKGDEITTIFWRYRAEPHNQVLGMLLFAGAVAFAGIWAPLAVLVLLAARAYPRARTPEERAAALAVGATSVVIAVQCFSDLGPFWPQYWIFTALALAVGGKLVVATGAWR